jgi:uncharacterized protein YdaT
MAIQDNINQMIATASAAAFASNSMEKQEISKLEQEDKLQRELVDVDRSSLKLQNDELKNKWEHRDLTSQMRQEKELFKTGKMDEASYIKSRQEAIRQQTLLKKQRQDFELQRKSLADRQSNLQKRLDLLGGKK